MKTTVAAYAIFCALLLFHASAQTTNTVAATAEEQAVTVKRDPFSPIGYVKDDDSPQVIEQIAPTPTPIVNWPELKPTAILLSPEGHVAHITGLGVIKEGQTVTNDVGRIRYIWKIESISKTTIVPTRLSAERIR